MFLVADPTRHVQREMSLSNVMNFIPSLNQEKIPLLMNFILKFNNLIFKYIKEQKKKGYT